MKNKKEIKPKDRVRLDRFKKENFIYSASAKKLSLAEKYKPINTPVRPNYNKPAAYLNRVQPVQSNNIMKMEEKKGDTGIPGLSYSERMKNNISKLNLLQVSDGSSKVKTPLKGILKKKPTPIGAVNSVNDTNLKMNTLRNSKPSNKFY